MADYRITDIDRITGIVHFDILNDNGVVVARDTVGADVRNKEDVVDKISDIVREVSPDNNMVAIPAEIKSEIGQRKSPKVKRKKTAKNKKQI